MSIQIKNKNFWSKLGLPFISTPSGERMKSMWVSTNDDVGSPVITLTNDGKYDKYVKMMKICKRIVYEVTVLGKQSFCPLSDDKTNNFSELNNDLLNKLQDNAFVANHLILMTDDNGNYKGIVIMDDRIDNSNNGYWYIDFLCVSKSGEGYDSKMIETIQQQLEKNPNIKYITAFSTDDELYKKHGFVDVYDYENNKYNQINVPCIKKISDFEDNKSNMVYCVHNKSQLTNIPTSTNLQSQLTNIPTSTNLQSQLTNIPTSTNFQSQPKFKIGDVVQVTKDITQVNKNNNAKNFMKEGELAYISSVMNKNKLNNGKIVYLVDKIDSTSLMEIYVNEEDIKLAEGYQPNTIPKTHTIHKIHISPISTFRISDSYLQYFVYKQYEFLQSLSKRDIDILNLYTYTGDRIINHVLRSNVTDEKKENKVLGNALKDFKTMYKGGSLFQESYEQIKKEGIGKIRAFVNEFLTVFKKVPKLEQSIIVYRGVEREEDINTHGNEFLSTSLLKSTALSFASYKGFLLKITIHPGVRALFIAPISNIPDEHEVLIGPPYKLTKEKVSQSEYNVNIYPMSSEGGRKTRRSKKQKQTRRN